MRVTGLRALTVALGSVMLSGARPLDETARVHPTISVVEYLGRQYAPGENVPIFRGVAADLIVSGQFVDLSTGVEVRTTGGEAVNDVSALITNRQSSRVTVRVTGASTAALRAYRILLHYTVETNGPDKFLVTLFEHGTVSSVTITSTPAQGTSIFAAGQVLSLRIQGSGLQRATLRPSAVRLPGMVAVDTACGACTSTDRTFKIKFDSAGAAIFEAGQLLYDGTLGFVPNAVQCGTMCYGGSGQLVITLGVRPQVTSATPANPAVNTTVTLNGSGLQPAGYTRTVRFRQKYRPPGSSETTVSLQGSANTLTFTAPPNVRPDSAILAYNVSGPDPDLILTGVVDLPLINVTGEAPQLQRLDSLGSGTSRRAFIKAGAQTIKGKHLAKGTLPVLQFGSQELTVTSAGYRANDGSIPGQTGADSVAFTIPFQHVSFSDTATRDLTITTQTGTAQHSATAHNVVFVPPPSVSTVRTCGSGTVCTNVPLSGGTLVRSKSYRLSGKGLVIRSQGTTLETVQVRVNGVLAQTSFTGSPSEFQFTVPQAATSGMVALTGSGGEATVGPFTVVDPPAAVDLVGFNLSPNNFAGGQVVTATIAINGTVPASGSAGNIFLTFTSSTADTTVQLPSGFIPVTSNPVVVAIPTRPVATQRSFTIRVQTDPNAEPADVLAASITVKPPAPTALSASETVVTGGRNVRTVVRLNTSAPAAAGIAIALTSSDPTTASVPASVVMNGDSAVFNVSVAIVPVDRQVTVTATSGGESRSVTLTVKAPVLSNVEVIPDSVIAGVSNAIASVTLTGAVANPVQATVTCDPALFCPATVTIPTGPPKVEFTFGARPATERLQVPVSVTFNGVTKTDLVRVKPLAIQQMTMSPDTVHAGVSASLTVQLNGPVPVGQSATVTFTSSAPSVVPAPSSLTFSPGEQVKLKTVSTQSPQAGTRLVTLTAVFTQTTPTGVNTSSDPVRITVIP